MRRLAWLAAVGGLSVLAGAASAGDFVTITGQVTTTPPPAPVIVNVNVDKPVCCKDGPLADTKIEVNPKNMGLKNVIVYLRPDNTDRAATIPADKIDKTLVAKPKEHVIDQPKCQFEPRVLAAREGDTLIVKNSAGIGHNVNYSSDAESFNVTIPPGKEKKLDNPLKAQRTPIAFKCDIHGWMAGRLRVFDHPYFAVTDADGKFEIKNAPAGKWRLVYWHEGGFHKGKDGILGFPVEIDGAKAKQELEVVKFEFPK